MTVQQDDLAMARRRLLKAESDRDLWRAASEHEKYMEAYCLCEVLELQLGALSLTRAEMLHMVVEGAA